MRRGRDESRESGGDGSEVYKMMQTIRDETETSG